MKKRIANAVELLLLLISFAILSTANIKLISGGAVSVIGASQKYALQFYPMCALYLLCSIMCVVSIVSKNQYKDGKAHGILALLLFIVTNWNVITCTPSAEILENNFPGAIFEIVLFLVVVVAFAKRSPLIAPTLSEQPQTVVNNIQSASNADELMKFKNLLDQGAITQEEYDKKKEELLN